MMEYKVINATYIEFHLLAAEMICDGWLLYANTCRHQLLTTSKLGQELMV
jgi:hypothetical protein